jgi:putrescine transport system ATP-binding protein
LGCHDVKVGERIYVAVRPEKIFISLERPEDMDGGVCVRGIVDDFGYFGNLSLYRIRLESGRMIQVSRQNQRRSAQRFVEWEDSVWVSWRPRSAIVLLD